MPPFLHCASCSPKGRQRIQFCHFNTGLRAHGKHCTREDPEGPHLEFQIFQHQPLQSIEEKASKREEGAPVQRHRLVTAREARSPTPGAGLFPLGATRDSRPPWETIVEDLRLYADF